MWNMTSALDQTIDEMNRLYEKKKQLKQYVDAYEDINKQLDDLYLQKIALREVLVKQGKSDTLPKVTALEDKAYEYGVLHKGKEYICLGYRNSCFTIWDDVIKRQIIWTIGWFDPKELPEGYEDKNL